MWKYKKQIKIRWLAFFIGSFLFFCFLYFCGNGGDSLLSQENFKSAVTSFSVNINYSPVWVLGICALLVLVATIVGIPSILIYAFLLIAFNCYIAFLLCFICQFFVTYFSMGLSFKLYKKENYEDDFRENLESVQEKFASFAFWSRVYYVFPLRTIDSFTPMIHPQKTSLSASLPQIAFAILLRMLIPVLWLNALYSWFSDFGADPAQIERNILFWTSVLIVYTVIPRAPELIICPEEFKKIFFKITPYSVSKKLNKNLDANGVNKQNNLQAENIDVIGTESL
ncbi:MAG: hypothetical protein PHF29_05250 [Candidatus Riflebacteria bacterium]|nr:hypothetical protein [Candidatus Riflebacteria bacterium]